jgi:hypothetical protein
VCFADNELQSEFRRCLRDTETTISNGSLSGITPKHWILTTYGTAAVDQNVLEGWISRGWWRVGRDSNGCATGVATGARTGGAIGTTGGVTGELTGVGGALIGTIIKAGQ